MREPLVTTTIIVHNGARFLADAIESALAQNYERHELVVVDDGSTDEGAAIAEGFAAARVIRRPHGGEGAARNASIAAARGDLNAILDADDVMLPGRLSTQVEALADPEVGCVLGLQELIREDGRTPDWSNAKRQAAPGSGHGSPSTDAYYAFPTLAIRRQWCDRIGAFADDMKVGADSDWLLRGFEAGMKPLTLDVALIKRRLHDRNATSDEHQVNASLAQIFQRRIARRRADSA